MNELERVSPIVTFPRVGLLLALLWLFVPAISAQQESPAARAVNGKIYLDVVVTAKSGPPVTGLQQKDFTVLDNKAPQTIDTFKALGGSQAPIEVILVVDEVNADFRVVGFERDQIAKYLGGDGGRLAFPTALSFFSDTGVEVQPDFSKDGNALTSSLDQHTAALRTVRRSAGFYGAAERYQLSLKALEMLLVHEAPRPGRKIIMWISPGWPLLSGPNVDMSSKQQEQVFENIVKLSDQLRAASMTLYNIDPLGVADIGVRTSYYKDFVKGVSEPRQVQAADLGLQVLATQTGGLVLNAANDLTAELQQCIADAQAYYEISFDPPLSDKVNEYHHIEIRVGDKKLTARTRQGYYAQPPNHN
ncbi:MAG: VWA domain-containing protein [Candidatus Acidiferrum sp.]